MVPKLRLSNLLLLLSTLANQPFLSLGEVKAPISTDTPIKLAKREILHSQNSIQSVQQEEVVGVPAAGVVEDYEDTTTTTRSTSSTTSEKNASPPTVHLIIHEPPHGSYIAGKHFFVGLQVVTSDSESERLVRAARDEYKVCISLDEGHYSCWSTNSTIVYANAIHGSHSLIAKLYRDGKLLDETASSLVTFTTVSDPTMNVSGVEFHSQFSHQPHAANKTNLQHPDGNVSNNNTSGDDVGAGGTDSDNESLTEEEGVNVSFPSVELLTPSNQVSYTGSDLIIDTSLTPQDPEQFSKYFQNSFICFSIDMATAQSCFQLFKDVKPLMVGLDIGFHTIEASLTNPETLELLEASRSGMKSFFMAGQDNKGAVFTAEINLRGKLHEIPIVKGGSLVAQTKALCRSVGLAEQGICLEPVYRHLVMVGRQVGFIHQQQEGGGF